MSKIKTKNTERKPAKKDHKLTAAEIGRKGAQAVLKKYGKGHMSKLGKLSAKKRWATTNKQK